MNLRVAVLGLVVPALAGIITSSVFAKPSIQQAGPERFEVASIKPCDPTGQVAGARGGGGPNFVSSPGRITVNCVNAAYLILRAFIMNGNQKADDPLNAWVSPASLADPQSPDVRKIRGGPAWVYTDKFSIEASAPGGAKDPELWGAMMRALLEDRFQLKLHKESEEAPMFALTVGKDGPKFSHGECIPFEQGTTNVAVARRENPGKFFCTTVIGDAPAPAMSFQIGGPIAELVRILRFAIKSPVVDQTGLTGIFKIAFQHGPDDVFSAVQEQLGLKLTAIKGRRGFLVIDRIEKPAPNAPAFDRKQP